MGLIQYFQRLYERFSCKNNSHQKIINPSKSIENPKYQRRGFFGWIADGWNRITDYLSEVFYGPYHRYPLSQETQNKINSHFDEGTRNMFDIKYTGKGIELIKKKNNLETIVD